MNTKRPLNRPFASLTAAVALFAGLVSATLVAAMFVAAMQSVSRFPTAGEIVGIVYFGAWHAGPFLGLAGVALVFSARPISVLTALLATLAYACIASWALYTAEGESWAVAYILLPILGWVGVGGVAAVTGVLGALSALAKRAGGHGPQGAGPAVPHNDGVGRGTPTSVGWLALVLGLVVVIFGALALLTVIASEVISRSR